MVSFSCSDLDRLEGSGVASCSYRAPPNCVAISIPKCLSGLHLLMYSASYVWLADIAAWKFFKFSGEMQESDKKQEKKDLKCSISINRGLIQAIPTSLPPLPIGEATKASNLRRIPPGVQGRSHLTYFLSRLQKSLGASWAAG
ncbi:hypothetical protein Tco_1511844, partial [Tanacetum coccineum]